jgi:plastocyanin
MPGPAAMRGGVRQEGAPSETKTAGMRRLLVLMMLSAVAVAPSGAHAANTVYVGVYNNQFVDPIVEARNGDTVTWSFYCRTYGYGGGSDSCDTHNVTAWSGASFSSGNILATNPPGSTSWSHTRTSDETVRYRCTLHSTLTSGTCNGMCGVIEPDLRNPAVRIFRPADPLVTVGTPDATITFAGDVKDNSNVVAMWFRVTSTLGIGGGTYDLPCPGGCPFTGQRLWEAPLTLGPGHYTVTANARDQFGRVGASPPINVIVV